MVDNVKGSGVKREIMIIPYRGKIRRGMTNPLN